MQKAPEERRKVKQNYWFLTNETAYLNGQQPHGRRDRRRGRRCCGEPEVRHSVPEHETKRTHSLECVLLLP